MFLFSVQCLTILLTCISCECQIPNDIPPHLKKQWMEEVQQAYKEYNPNPGYEPYWADGAWVFVDRDAKNNISTTKMQLVCGEECNYLHKRIKEVCGRQVYYGDSQCHLPHCLIDDFTQVFLNFNTYCEFLNKQCREKEIGRQWVLVHAGRCVVPQDTFLKPVRYGGQIASRVSRYFTRISEVFWNNTLPSPL